MMKRKALVDLHADARVDDLDLPPLEGGHELPPPLPPPPPPLPAREFFVSEPIVHSSSGPRHRPSQRKHRLSDSPPPPSAEQPWKEASSWMVQTFERRHLLLRPALQAYLQPVGVSSSKRCHTVEGFFQAFWTREQGKCARALGAAVQFLLMELWRARLVVRATGAVLGAPPFALPAERRHLRDLVDPLLQAASAEAAESTQSHRESVEFADVVVALALMALRKRMLSGAADADADLSSGKSSGKQAAAAGDQQAAPGVVAGVGPPPHGKASGSHPRR